MQQWIRQDCIKEIEAEPVEAPIVDEEQQQTEEDNE